MFDSHAHLTDSRFKEDHKDVIRRALEAGITGILTVLTSPDDEPLFNELLNDHAFIYGAIGLHPGEAADDLSWIRRFLNRPRIVAIGEIGLDYHYKENPAREIQIKVFREQLELARENNLPVIIHCRDAWEDMLKILAEIKACKGVMHCFSGDENQLEKSLGAGLYISIPGTVTFPKAEKVRQVAGLIPSDKLMIETDCPYLSPEPKRGKRNEPAFMKYTAEKVAETRKVSVEEIMKITEQNTKRLFKI